MIGIDTNVLVRYFARDDARQTPSADALIDALSRASRGYVPVAVVVELVWTMGSHYGATRRDIARIVQHLVQSADLRLESEAIARDALRLFLLTSSDFPDCLILLACRNAGCHQTMTFDRKAAQSIGMKLVN